jgi:hypothetical protein
VNGRMRISSTGAIDGGRVLYTNGKIKAASSWHAASGPRFYGNMSLNYVKTVADGFGAAPCRKQQATPVMQSGLVISRDLIEATRGSITATDRIDGPGGGFTTRPPCRSP